MFLFLTWKLFIIAVLLHWHSHMKQHVSPRKNGGMTPIVLFKSDDEYGVLPADEVEDAEIVILFEYDPYTGGHSVH